MSPQELLDMKSSDRLKTQTLIINQVNEWKSEGFPFTTPTFQKDTLDFAASTENTTGQGYWFEIDQAKDDEVILYIKTPPGVAGNELDTSSPYKSQTVRLCFLNWFPEKARLARRKAQEARVHGYLQRAIQLEYRAARLEDMNKQLQNTIHLQRFTRELATERAQHDKNEDRINRLKTKVRDLKNARRTAPPIIRM